MGLTLRTCLLTRSPCGSGNVSLQLGGLYRQHVKSDVQAFALTELHPASLRRVYVYVTI